MNISQVDSNIAAFPVSLLIHLAVIFQKGHWSTRYENMQANGLNRELPDMRFHSKFLGLIDSFFHLFQRYFNSSRVILCLEARQSRLLYIYIYTFCLVVSKYFFYMYQIFLSNTNNLHTVVLSQVFLSKSNNYKVPSGYFYLIITTCKQLYDFK